MNRALESAARAEAEARRVLLAYPESPRAYLDWRHAHSALRAELQVDCSDRVLVDPPGVGLILAVAVVAGLAILAWIVALVGGGA